MAKDIVERLKEPAGQFGKSMALCEEAANEIIRLRGIIQTVANNIACGPDNIVEWSEKVKAALTELDRLQQMLNKIVNEGQDNADVG